jgi:hypothetical protein
MRISKTWILVTGLLATLSLTLVSCSDKDHSTPNLPVTSTPPTSSPVVNKTNQEKIIGTWISQVNCSQGSIKMEVTYFQNGSYNSSSNLSVRENIDGEEVEFSFSFEGSGEWIVNDKTMTDKIINARLNLKSLRKGATQFDLQKTDDPTVSQIIKNADFKKIIETTNQSFVQGQSTKYKIIKLNEDEMKLENTSNKKIDACLKLEKYKKVSVSK